MRFVKLTVCSQVQICIDLLSFIKRIFHCSMLKCAVRVMRWREHTGQPSVRENWCTHYAQTVSNHSWPKPQLSYSKFYHTPYAHSVKNGVYVILVSDQWHPGLIDIHPGSFTCSGMTLRIYMGPTAVVVSKPWETHFPILKGFYTLQFW